MDIGTGIGKIETERYGVASIEVNRYPKGGAIYVRLVCDDDGEPLLVFSTNLVPSAGVQLAHNEFNVRGWGGGEKYVQPMMATGLFRDTGRSVKTGFVSSPIWSIVDPSHVPPALTADELRR